MRMIADIRAWVDGVVPQLIKLLPRRTVEYK